jgi:hypothetical protein
VYNPAAPLLLHVYTVTHFLLALALLDTLASSFQAGFPGSIVLEDFLLSLKHKAIQTYDVTSKGPSTCSPYLTYPNTTSFTFLKTT